MHALIAIRVDGTSYLWKEDGQIAFDPRFDAEALESPERVTPSPRRSLSPGRQGSARRSAQKRAAAGRGFGASGQHWQRLSSREEDPRFGERSELSHVLLGAALVERTADGSKYVSFDAAEWRAFGVEGLRFTHFVERDGAHFIPVAEFEGAHGSAPAASAPAPAPAGVPPKASAHANGAPLGQKPPARCHEVVARKIPTYPAPKYNPASNAPYFAHKGGRAERVRIPVTPMTYGGPCRASGSTPSSVSSSMTGSLTSSVTGSHGGVRPASASTLTLSFNSSQASQQASYPPNAAVPGGGVLGAHAPRQAGFTSAMNTRFGFANGPFGGSMPGSMSATAGANVHTSEVWTLPSHPVASVRPSTAATPSGMHQRRPAGLSVSLSKRTADRRAESTIRSLGASLAATLRPLSPRGFSPRARTKRPTTAEPSAPPRAALAGAPAMRPHTASATAALAAPPPHGVSLGTAVGAVHARQPPYPSMTMGPAGTIKLAH